MGLTTIAERHPAGSWRPSRTNLVTGCRDAESLLNNKVTFITFNYDVSLEYQLLRGLSALQQFSGNNTSRGLFFEGNRFIHIYGKVREDAIAEPAPFNLGLSGGDLLSQQREPNSASNDIESFFDTIYIMRRRKGFGQ